MGHICPAIVALWKRKVVLEILKPMGSASMPHRMAVVLGDSTVETGSAAASQVILGGATRAKAV